MHKIKSIWISPICPKLLPYIEEAQDMISNIDIVNIIGRGQKLFDFELHKGAPRRKQKSVKQIFEFFLENWGIHRQFNVVCNAIISIKSIKRVIIQEKKYWTWCLLQGAETYIRSNQPDMPESASIHRGSTRSIAWHKSHEYKRKKTNVIEFWTSQGSAWKNAVLVRAKNTNIPEKLCIQ